MRQNWKRRRPDDLISAAELASFVYCPEQWRLEQALGLAPTNQAERKAGERHHDRKAVAEQIAGGSINLGRRLAAAAIALAVAGVLLLWGWR
ncbi:hypothetical protein [Paludisphaera borealis]|uniref:Uncharacterized protein n=1 Tax=Paludisphaera borealis TaxID=1387353 RepID=A0A1U7CZE8_9BACT|nr:hypothetical protein [Paludisphaera borealis]APW64314.1 hypothetical protein BSF38_20032 [Paludisphaera borealis]